MAHETRGDRRTGALGAFGERDRRLRRASESSSGSADLTLWTGFTDRELGVMKDVIADFEKTHPDIHVKVVGGISDDKIVAAIRGGNAPDVAHSFDAGAYTGAYCSNGASMTSPTT